MTCSSEVSLHKASLISTYVSKSFNSAKVSVIIVNFLVIVRTQVLGWMGRGIQKEGLKKNLNFRFVEAFVELVQKHFAVE